MIRIPSLATVAIAVAIAVAGCGSDDEGTAEVRPAPDVSAKKAKLQKQLAAAKRQARETEDQTEAAAPGFDEEASSMLAALPGSAGLVVGAPGVESAQLQAGSLTSGFAWSTIKVPIAERVLADANGPGGLTSAQSEQISAAITLSDNEAAAALFRDLETNHGGLEGASQAVGEMLSRAGDTGTKISRVGRGDFTTYGQTEWSLAAQNRYMAALAGGCVSDPASRDFLLEQMANVTADPWGLGSAGVPVRWKGGWGPELDGKYLVRQMGVLTVGGQDLVVTLAAVPDDGSFESGQAMATEIARWVAGNINDEAPAATECGAS